MAAAARVKKLSTKYTVKTQCLDIRRTHMEKPNSGTFVEIRIEG